MTERVVMTPYRKGIAAGLAEARAFKQWQAEASATRDFSKPRPPRAQNPYDCLLHKRGNKHWEDGKREAFRREGLR